ncbi:hypothetical protein CTAM01_08077 [Colletotrichum tamarilloi]|uniref:Uncharacterized protein n=1 Tax=Colletotrichum tamarilloi TaxID=1209934 RepID=A0ABQ9R761_9PEZI|nr:uncharacterized protein CTAM01_08077 [Colletotrichum tamarilloi]KAI3544650.1 hypothetical protein CSPX01_05449 [Colletotrichum filicis]KAK1497065.1 hypothetical protein CTAM01_08077 [Colletotrichum tamarilloi]
MNRPACTRGLFPAGLLQAPSRSNMKSESSLMPMPLLTA